MEQMVNVYLFGKKYQVPESLTIMESGILKADQGDHLIHTRKLILPSGDMKKRLSNDSLFF